MDPDQYDALHRELIALCEKYDVTAAAFCGASGDQYVGMLLKKKFSPSEFFLTVTNVGRLWQWAREETKGHLDRFERKW